jgi:hypothetical protein
MGFPFDEQAGIERRWFARHRYPNRPLFWALPRLEAGRLEHCDAAQGICLSACRPLQPGQGVMVQLPGPATLLMRVASVARRPDGSWLLRCDLAGSPPRPGAVRTVA